MRFGQSQVPNNRSADQHPSGPRDKLLITGMIAPVWLCLGVAVTGFMYPGYSHLNQAMSELGAVGAPTASMSPYINNYPLGVLFVLFGIAIFRAFPQSRLAVVSAALIVIHGFANWGTGLFACDMACQPATPSISHSFHMLFGMIMFLSLLLANALWVPLSLQLLNSKLLFWCSLAALSFGVVTVVAMSSTMESGGPFGLYQRLNYGVALLWVFVLSLSVYRGVDLALEDAASGR